jgi:hypothetical protein
MQTDYSVDELLEFLNHAADRGLMPAATAKALEVSSRKVFSSLSDDERADLRTIDLDSVVKRFGNKHAKEFTPTSLRAYGQRATRAVDQFLKWRENPAGFSVKTRSTVSSRKRVPAPNVAESLGTTEPPSATVGMTAGSYQTSFPIRPGKIVTVANLPNDLSTAEAERLAQFIKMLVVD